MGIIDQIKQMRQQGMSDSQIIQNLQEQGISPRQINDALNQLQIKSAVMDVQSANQQDTINPPQTYSQTKEIDDENYYVPQPAIQKWQQQYPPTEETYAEYPSYENYAQNPYYEQQPSYSDTMIEIAEQVFTQKVKDLQKQLSSLNEFKTIAQSKIDNIDARLKKIESIIEKLQIAILEKVGSYGKELQAIKNEMSMMQDSFGKIVNQSVSKNKPATSKKTPRKRSKR